jgi:hypothetical protein
MEKDNHSYDSLKLFFGAMKELNIVMNSCLEILHDKEANDEEKFYLLVNTFKMHGLKIDFLLEADMQEKKDVKDPHTYSQEQVFRINFTNGQIPVHISLN